MWNPVFTILWRKAGTPPWRPTPREGEVLLRVASAGSREEADRMMEPVIEKVKELFGDNVYGVDIGSQAALVAELQKKG
ncbi:MAG: hypothetical protein ACLR30_05210 [[Clostridium] leptum]